MDWTAIGPEFCTNFKNSECVLTHCTTHRLRNRTQFIAFFKLISSSAVFGPATASHRRCSMWEALLSVQPSDMRYWASHDNLFQFALVPLQSYENYQLAWAFGCSAIVPPTLRSAMREVAAKHYPSVQVFVPFFHVPKISLREVPHQSVKKFLYNFQSWEETMWDPAFKLDAVPCPCAKYRNKLPDRGFSSGHVAAGLEEFEAMVLGCGSITSASAASTFFPGRAHWMTKSRALFDQWLKRHRLPTTLHPMFQKFCEEQWLQHVNTLEPTPRLNWAMLQRVKSTLHKDLVLRNEDHRPNHIVCFCPRFFLRGLCSTWDDPSVFRSLDGSPENWRQKMLDEIPAQLSRRYSWSSCKSASLPRGTVFLKRKKQFAKGRT
eukprot:s8874_g3.t1